MYIRDRSRLIVKSWGTHALKSAREGTCPLITTLSFRFLKKLNNFIKYFNNCSTFGDFRCILYTKKNKTLRSLPPTSNISHGDELRSYYVVLNCSNLISVPDTNLNLVEFDWNSVDSVLMPNKFIVTLPNMYTFGCKKNALEGVSAASLALHAQIFASATEKNDVPNFTNRVSLTQLKICKYKRFL